MNTPSLLMSPKLTKQLEAYLSLVEGWFHSREPREKILLVVAFLTVTVLLLHYLASVGIAYFEEQDKRYQAARDRAEQVVAGVQAYTVLKRKHDAIESKFREAQIEGAVASYVEALYRAAFPDAPPILPRVNEATDFGGGYQQEVIELSFSTSRFGELMQFLREISFGEKPLAIRSLELDMPTNRLQLNVRLSLAAIRRRDDANL